MPVIASRNGGIPEIAQHGRNRLLVQDFSEPTAVAEQIEKLSKDSEPVYPSKPERTHCIDSVWRLTATRLMRFYETST
ncbi:glycosyltransferase [Paenibacillus sp. UNC496MF]|uniref:glycosyltransferase n=1 Tax=Paenibacillus sp. UNC496MF TaxID=1502753 RepID=UPI0035298EAF